MIINFTSATANKINIEDYSCWKQSLFQEAYSKAKRCLNEIVCADIELREKVTGDKDPFSRLYEENNKTIAFVGDRGSGKTSAMVSFVKACTENKIALFKSELPVNCNFFSLPVIEPSKLAEGESIVGFVVSQIYSDLEKSLERDREKIPRPLLESIVSDCTDLREALRVQGMTTVELLRQNTDELAHLRLLSQTKRLTEKLGDLVQNYLELRASVYRNGAVYPTKFLIIPIDDLDTSIPNAYRQIEELRNYLMLPGIIVTLALKIEQLSDALEQQHINALKDLFHHKLIADAQPAEMAAKYIQKVIPDQRRVELPSFDLNVLPDCTVIIDPSGKPEGLFECFADLVRRKLGIIMIPDERLSHPLIPHNLRALHQAILMLQEMKEIDDDGQKGENGKATALLQLQKFESWIIELLYASTLNETLIEILRKFVSHSDRNLAAFLWRSLETYLSGKKTAVEVSALLQRNISNENISIGNVLHLLTTLHKTEVEDDFTLVGAVVRMLYSIRIRRQMLRSLEVNESVTLKQSLKLMPELGFERVWTIFNGLVYDTQERLTYDGFENMPNADASTGKVCYQTSRRVISLTGDEESAPAGPIDSDENMSVEEAVWCSFFVVCFGRVAQEDVHSLKTSVLYSIMEPHTQRIAGALETGSSGPSFVYANWMAFVHNILRPRYTSHRLLWQTELSATNESDELSTAISKFETLRFSLLFERMHIDSIDFLDAIIRNMVDNKAEICQNSKDKLATMSGFFDFSEGLRKALFSANKLAGEKVFCDSSKTFTEGADPLESFLQLSDKDKAYQRFRWLWNG